MRRRIGAEGMVGMGFYTEYLDAGLDFVGLQHARRMQLDRISALRGGRDVLVYAADYNKSQAPIQVNYSDLLPITDQLDTMSGQAVDVILETPGGSGEAAEDIVRLLHGKYTDVAFIVPGWAKSAGTIMVMAGDEILMGPASALGPIDAQLFWQGKVFSADALIEGMEKIKDEVDKTGTLNKAYIPMLQGISPGELQTAENALNFAKLLVTDWLARYKFKDWNTHASTGEPVTGDEKRQRAEQIAQRLCDHRAWKTHSRSLKIDDLETMRLKITDYSKQPDLDEAIRRYHTLLQMTLECTGIYKLFETRTSGIYRMLKANEPPGQPTPNKVNPVAAESATVDVQCQGCEAIWKVQANFAEGHPVKEGSIPFPANNKLNCPNCGRAMDLGQVRVAIEKQAQRPIS